MQCCFDIADPDASYKWKSWVILQQSTFSDKISMM